VFQDFFAAPAAPTGAPLVTFVCTGNICRSPLAEKLLRARLSERPSNDILVASAGLHAVVGASMEPEPTAIAIQGGADPAHIGSQVSEDLLRSSSLILTMTRDQRAELAQEFPFALKRTFTLVEFVRILDELPAQVALPDRTIGRTIFDAASDAARFRGMIAIGVDDDVDDPYRRSLETHERVGNRISGLVSDLATRLVP
jgi:protein-tyrosine phosphatase